MLIEGDGGGLSRRALSPLCMAAHLVSGAPGSIIWLRFYLPCDWWQTIANLRPASATPLVTQVCICGAFSFGSRLSALRYTHNPSELHGKRMAERLPLQCSGALSGGTLCHLPTVMPHRFWHGQLGIEPTTRGFGDRIATLEHLPAYSHNKPDVAPVSPFVSICVLTFRRRTSRPLLWQLPSKSHLLCAITPNRFNFGSRVCSLFALFPAARTGRDLPDGRCDLPPLIVG